MTRYLVDTNVISAVAPTSPVRRTDLVEWMDSHSADLFLSAVTIAEIADGIAKAKREGARRKASDLSPGCKQCYISMASECCPSTAQLHSSPVPWPIWLAAVVILQDLRISLSLNGPSA